MRFKPYGEVRLCVLLCCLVTVDAYINPQAAPSSAETELRRAEILKVEESLPKIADRGAALFFLARRYAQLGQLDKALSLLKDCIALDQGFDPEEKPQLQALHANPEFQALVEQVRRRYPPVHRARVAFTVPEMDLFPEGLAVDSSRHIFYMGSMMHKKIIRIVNGQVSDFVKAGVYTLPEIGGIKVDPKDHGLWAAAGDDHDSELLHFDAQGKLLEHFRPSEAGPHILNDLVLRPGDEVYVTDTLSHQVYRFDRSQESLVPMSFHRPLLYPNGIALSDDNNWLYVADILGVIQVDLRDQTSREVDPGQHSTLAGIDGLYWYKGSLVGIQYGNGPYRVARWRLSRNGRTVRSTEIFEYRTSLISFPTTGAILGDSFYFIANTGIANYKDGKVVDPAKLEPIHIGVVTLR
jgi:hypothetical protein